MSTHWERENLLDFFDRTFPAPSISADETFFDGLVKESIGNLSAEVVKMIGTNVLGNFIPGITKLFLGIPGFIVGALVETITGNIIDDKIDLVDKAAESKKNIRSKVTDKFNTLRTTIGVENKDIYGELEKVRNVNQLNIVHDDIKNLSKFYQSSTKDSNNRDLFYSLLKEWVLENANSDDGARKGLSEKKWDKSIKELHQRGALVKGEKLENHPDIFAYQTRLFLSKSVGKPGNFLSKLIMDEVGTIHNAFLSEYKTDDKNDIEKLQKMERDYIYDKYDGFKFTFTKAESKKLLALFDDYGWTMGIQNSKRKLREARSEFMNDIVFEVELDLEKSGNAVYVDCWEINLSFPELRENDMPWKIYPGDLYKF